MIGRRPRPAAESRPRDDGRRFLRGEALLGLAVFGALLALHLVATTARPLCRPVFFEHQGTFLDAIGGEAMMHNDRLVTLDFFTACTDGLASCLLQTAHVADAHHPPIPIMLSALPGLFLGRGIVPSLLSGFGAAMAMLLGIHLAARQVSGRRGAWLAVGVAVACPVLFLPSRMLHVDIYMLGALALTLAAAVRFQQRGSPWAWIALVAAGTAATLSKWEGGLGVYAALVGLGVTGLFSRHRVRVVLGVLAAPVAIGRLLHAYVTTGGSPSYAERAGLVEFMLVGTPGVGVEMLAGWLDGSQAAVDPGQVELAGSLSDRLLYYLGALPAASAGLYPTVLLALGLLVAPLRGRGAAGRMLLRIHTVVSLVVVAAGANSFVDDRFLHFPLLSACALAGIGLARLPLGVSAAAVTGVAAVMLADGSFVKSPLWPGPVFRLPPGPCMPVERDVMHRPGPAQGHPSWVRPGMCVPSVLEPARAALGMARDAGAERVIVSVDARGDAAQLATWTYILAEEQWDLELFSLRALIGNDASGVHACPAVDPAWFTEEVFVPGTAFVWDARGRFDPTRESCGQVQDLADEGLRIEVVGQVGEATGSPVVGILRAAD